VITKIAIILLLMPLMVAGIEVEERGSSMKAEGPTADSLLEKADEIFQSRDYEAALSEYTRVLETARSEFNRSVETEALAQLARVHLQLNRKDEGRGWLRNAAQKAMDSDPMGWSRYLGVRGRFEWKDDDLAASRKTFNEMFVYCNTNALWSRAVDAAHMIAIVAENPEEQIEWSRKGIEAAESGGVESWLGPLWNNLAGTYYDMKQYDSALTCYIKAREYHWRFSGEVAKLYADYHVGMANRLAGNLDEAEKWLRPVLAWAERLENHSAVGQACEDMAEIRISRGNEKEGLALLKRARSEYKAAGFDESWPEIWNGINIRIDQVEK
jgi:tetratricopeptide (TPR) repeat protein